MYSNTGTLPSSAVVKKALCCNLCAFYIHHGMVKAKAKAVPLHTVKVLVGGEEV
jgi:hypothetical protein